MLGSKRLSVRLLAAGLFAGCLLASSVHADDNNGGPPPAGQQGGGQGGDGQGGGGRPPQGGVHLIPRFAEQKLNLTDDQKKQIADLEKEVKAKLAKILTPDQMKTLNEARPQRPGGGGQGGRGQGGGGGQGGGQGGPPPSN